MSVEKDLFARLSGFAGLAALVGTRIFPVELQQGCAMPAISYHRVSATRQSAMGQDTGLVRARFQVSAWDESPDVVSAVAEQVRLALQRYSGTGTVPIEVIFFLNEVDFYEGNSRLHHKAMDFEVNYRE